MKAAEF